MTRRRARAETSELREDEPHPVALLAARRELGADLRKDSFLVLGVGEALQAEWIAHRTSCRRGAATSRSVGRVMPAEKRHRALEHLQAGFTARESSRLSVTSWTSLLARFRASYMTWLCSKGTT